MTHASSSIFFTVVNFLLSLSYLNTLCNTLPHTGSEYVKIIPHLWGHSHVSPVESIYYDISRNSRAATANIVPSHYGLQMIEEEFPTSLDWDIDSEEAAPFKLMYRWKKIDFTYPNEDERNEAIKKREFIPENNLPLGIAILGQRIFITLPRWKTGVPASLVWLPLPPMEDSPKMMPYPNWEWHSTIEDCSKIISVFRVHADECGRLWVLDAGVIDTITDAKQVCPPKIMIFDLETDDLLLSYEFPKEQVKQNSLFSNIIVDVRDGKCDEAFAYVTDVWRYALLTFDLKKQKSWRILHHLFFPDPFASDLTLHGVNFQWTDGVFGISLAPVNKHGDRVLFFHPMSSFYEFQVSSAMLRNESAWTNGQTQNKEFQMLGYRGYNGQSSTSAVDRDGIMFYNLVLKDSVGCWDLRKPYNENNLGIVGANSTSLIFPNDLKLDYEYDQGLWVLSNRLPDYLYKGLDYEQYNFRILRTSTREAVCGTVCDPILSYR